MGIVLSIDVGTTNIKAGLVNESGELLAFDKSPITTHSSEPGAAEHLPGELQKVILNLCVHVLDAGYRKQVTSIAISTYHFGVMLQDADRQPLTPMTLLTDTRSQQTFNNFISDFRSLNLYERTGCPLLSQYPLPRLYYFFKKKPELFRNTKFIVDSKSFLIEWLTGESITDVSIANAMQLYNAKDFCWDEEILQRISLTCDQFPVVEDGHTTLLPLSEKLTAALGLQKNVHVLLGVYDGAAMAVGLGGLDVHAGCMNVGTTAMIRLPSQNPVFDTQENKWIQPYALYRNFFLNGGALNNASLALDWLNKSIGTIDVSDPTLSKINTHQPLFSLPYLTGERDSLHGPFASGIFFGLRRDHDLQDMVRAVMEGVAYSARFIYDALETNNLKIKEMHMGGGGAQCGPWAQIFANVLDVPITISQVVEIALIGNAMLAFTAAGVYSDIAAAYRCMVREGNRIEPDSELTPVYAKHYVFFKHLRAQAGELFREHAALTANDHSSPQQ